MIEKWLVKQWGKIDLESLRLRENFHGVSVFVGKQGAGKSVSMLNSALSILKNDKSKQKVYTNINVGHSDFVTLNDVEMTDILNTGSNCIIMIDEIHLYFYSKNRNSQEVIVPFSQLRKRNIIVLGTSQVWFHLDKSVRDQALFLVACRKTWFSLIFKNQWIPTTGYTISEEGNLEIKQVSFTTRFFRQSYLFDLYDSYETIKLQK